MALYRRQCRPRHERALSEDRFRPRPGHQHRPDDLPDPRHHRGDRHRADQPPRTAVSRRRRELSIRPRTAALANAIFDTSGVRLRRAALTRERVEPALRRRPCAHTSGADYRTKPEGGTGCDQSPAIGGSRTRGGCRGAWSQHPQAGRKPRGIRASRSCGGSVGLDRRHEGGRPISLAVPRKRSAGHSPPEGHDVRRADGAHLLCDGSGLWGHLLGRLQALEAQTKLERTAASTSRPTRR